MTIHVMSRHEKSKTDSSENIVKPSGLSYFSLDVDHVLCYVVA